MPRKRYSTEQIVTKLRQAEVELGRGPTLFGVVEVDETMVGGKIRGKGRKAARANKVYVAGAIQRGGKVRLKRVPNVRRHTLHGFIAETVKDEAEAIYTDELKSYLGIEDEDTRHKTVNHSAEQWVLGDVHTNSIEGVWSLFKRSIVGSFHKISVKQEVDPETWTAA